MLTGGCYCRAIRYEIHSNPFDTTLCRCATCRRVSAAPAVAWFSVSKGGLRRVQGTQRRLNPAQGFFAPFAVIAGRHWLTQTPNRPTCLMYRPALSTNLARFLRQVALGPSTG
jgi:hypothetical protein